MKKRACPSRHGAERWGRMAEHVAAARLWCCGYRIIARRVRNHFGEIDLIALRGKTLAFVEVKARNDVESAHYAVTRNSQQRILRAALAWAAARAEYAGHTLRFDLMVIRRWGWPLHVRDAWRE